MRIELDTSRYSDEPDFLPINISTDRYFDGCISKIDEHASEANPERPVQTETTLLDVTCCAKFETGQTFQPTTPNVSFVP